MTNRFHRLRRLSGVVLLAILIGLPFLHIQGESALRFDVPSLRLLFFGSEIWINDFFIVLIAIIFFTFLVLFATTVLGRIWCGWLCPQTVLVDMTSFIEHAGARGVVARMSAVAAGLMVSAVIAVSTVGYFISPYDIPLVLKAGGLQSRIATGSWLALTVLLFLDLLTLRRRFCATVCPYAKMQNVLFDDRTLIVAFDRSREKECMHCAACVKACPVGIDIRCGANQACIHCAECVDACSERMASRKSPSLVRYAFGSSAGPPGGLRLNTAITGVLTATSLVFLVYLSLTRMPFDANVRLDFGAAHMKAAAGIVNQYELSLRNMSRSDLELDLVAVSSIGTATISPSKALLRRGADVTRIPAAITVTGIPDRSVNAIISITISSARDRKRIVRSIQFMMPKS